MKHPGGIRITFGLLAGIALGMIALPAHAIDWSTVKGRDIALMFPGQSSWEWILTPSGHDGAQKFRSGKNCRGCHQGEQKDIGEATLSGKNPKGQPVEGMKPVVMLNVKAAHDAERLYVRLEWNDTPGPAGPKQDPKTEAAASIFWDDGHVFAFDRGGCWSACHNDLVGMPDAKPGMDLTMYLPASRTKITMSGGGENYKSPDQLAKLMGEGHFLEYWHARLNRGQAPVPVDGYVLDKRHENTTPMIQAKGGFSNGKWVVIFSRKLHAGAPGHKDFVPGKTYIVGFAIHDGWATGRYHHVSFQYTLALDQGNADIIAVKR